MCIYLKVSVFFQVSDDTVVEESGAEKEQGTSSSLSQERATYSRSSINSNLPPPKKKIARASGSLSVQNELLQKACSILESTNKPEKPVPAILMAWGDKLETLESQQRALAEKAINDILFEASQGTLHRHSVKINEDYQRATPSPYNSFTTSGSKNSWVNSPPPEKNFYQFPNYNFEDNANANFQFGKQFVTLNEQKDTTCEAMVSSAPQNNNNMSLSNYYAQCTKDFDINEN